MTISLELSPPLSPCIGVNETSPRKKKTSKALTKVSPSDHCSSNCDDETSTSSSSLQDDLSAISSYCQPCGTGYISTIPVLRRRKGARTVSFSSTTQEFEILPRRDYTAEEFTATWYSGAECDNLRKARKVLLQRMDNTTNWEHLESTDCSIRGLENKTKVGRRKRYAELAAVIAAVIDEQDAQYARGILKASVIAKLCEMHTRQSMTQARSQGLKDARVAKLLLR